MSSANALPERAEQIFAAAYELFAAQGYHRTSMDAIAERAGVAKGTLYWYFKSKRELFIALFHHVTMGLINPWAPTEEGAYISPTERLKAAWTQFRNSTEQILRIAHIMIQARAIDLDETDVEGHIAPWGPPLPRSTRSSPTAWARGEFRPVSPQGMSLALTPW
jgi:AcrR family transcriptional regulator